MHHGIPSISSDVGSNTDFRIQAVRHEVPLSRLTKLQLFWIVKSEGSF